LPIDADPNTSAAGRIFLIAASVCPGCVNNAIGFPSMYDSPGFPVIPEGMSIRNVSQSKPSNVSEPTNRDNRITASQKFGIARQTIPETDAK
jgi:hypothetical protein